MSNANRTLGSISVGAWLLSAMLFIHRVFILAVDGDVTDDFTTVYSALRRFLEDTPVYNENYAFVDPHYLYSPGATLLLSPLGLVTHFDLARLLFIIANAVAIIAALGVIARMLGYGWTHPVWPVSVAAAFLTETVRNTLIFSNINGLLFLALVLFYLALILERRWAAGVLIGLAILIKPIFAPLLFLPLVKSNWQTILAGLGLPVLLNAVAWPIVPGASDYVTKTLAFVGGVRDFSNSSLRGMAVWSGLPSTYTVVLWLLFAAAVAVGLIVLLRYRYAAPTEWTLWTGSLLLVGVFFLSSLGQMYYSMFLFPLVMTVVGRFSPMHNPLAWLAAYGIFSSDSWIDSERFPTEGMWIQYLLPTLGWATLILVMATFALTLWQWERRASVGALSVSR